MTQPWHPCCRDAAQHVVGKRSTSSRLQPGAGHALNACALLLWLASTLWSSSSAHASDFWDSVRTPGLGAAKLAIVAGREALGHNRANEALQRADAAIASCPGCADAHTLRGRALAVQGRSGDALAAFERARALDPEALLDAESARVAATCALVVGRADLAVSVLSVAHAASDAAERDASELLLADAHQVSGPSGLANARLLYGAISPRPELGPAATLGLALALHRGGEIEAALAMARRLESSEAEQAVRLPWLPSPERSARLALWLTALGDFAGADARWREASEGGGAFTTHARQTREQLAPKGKPR